MQAVEITIGGSEENWDWQVGAGLCIIDEGIRQDSELASDIFILPFLISASYVKKGGAFIKKECGSSHNRRKS